MPRQSLISPNPALPALPLDSTAARVVAVLLGTLVLTLSSRLQVPMVPVPMTMQTLAVTLIGALYGWRLGALMWGGARFDLVGRRAQIALSACRA